MKRPLMWVIVWFALGEVLAINVSDNKEASVLVVALAFCVLLNRYSPRVLRDKLCEFLGGDRRIWIIYVWLAAFVLGVCDVHLQDYRMASVLNKLKNEVDSDGSSGAGEDNEHTTDEYEVSFCAVISDRDDGTVTAKIAGGYYVTMYRFTTDANVGDAILVTGELKRYESARNPGAFDRCKYNLARKNIGYMSKYEAKVLPGETSKVRKYIYRVRASCKNCLNSITDADTAAMYQGILLGDKDDINPLVKLSFQICSILHIISISGLHVSMISAMILKLLQRFGLSRNVSSILTMILLVLYGEMTGFGVATVRAIIMMIMSVIARMIARDYDILTANAFAFGYFVLINPYKLYDSGMWLSVGAIIGVHYASNVVNVINKKIERSSLIQSLLIKKILKYLTSLVLVSVGINLITFPILINMYYQFCPYSFLINLLVIPFMAIVLASGIVAVVVFGISSMLIPSVATSCAGTIIVAGKAVLKLYQLLCNTVIGLPGYIINTGKPSLGQMVVYYICVAAVYMIAVRGFRFGRYVAVLGGVILSGIGIIAVIEQGKQEEQIIFMDVGQGDGIAIRTESGINMCIDGGSSSADKTGQYVLMPVLKSHRMAKVDYWFVSHTDKDHISGLMEILELGRLSGISIDNIVFSNAIENDENYEELIKLAKQNHVNLLYMNLGDKICGEEFDVTCVYPMNRRTDISLESAIGSSTYNLDKNVDKNIDKNDTCLALLYESEDIRLWLVGDLGTESLNELAVENIYVKYADCANDNYDKRYVNNANNNDDNRYVTNVNDNKIDIVKVPHHGSKNSLSYEFYNMIEADVAVISCEFEGRYGHPHKEVLEALEEYNISIYRTDISGAIVWHAK